MSHLFGSDRFTGAADLEDEVAGHDGGHGADEVRASPDRYVTNR